MGMGLRGKSVKGKKWSCASVGTRDEGKKKRDVIF